MFYSRHQLQQALRRLDAAQGSPCPQPRRVDVQERLDDNGDYTTVPNPEPEFTMKDGRPIRTNADPLPNPHGRAFLVVDPETDEVLCAACEPRARRGPRGGR